MKEILSPPEQAQQLDRKLVRAMGVVGAHVRSVLVRWHLSPPKWFILNTLGEAGPEGLMLSDVANRVQVTSGNVTGMVDRLEEGGFVERVPDQQDRRVIRARLTAQGETVYREIHPQHARHLELVFGCLSDRERTILGRLLDKLINSAPGAEECRP